MISRKPYFSTEIIHELANRILNFKNEFNWKNKKNLKQEREVHLRMAILLCKCIQKWKPVIDKQATQRKYTKEKLYKQFTLFDNIPA